MFIFQKFKVYLYEDRQIENLLVLKSILKEWRGGEFKMWGAIAQWSIVVMNMTL